MAAEHRDQPGDQRDRAAERRDQAAEERNEAADRRDETAERSKVALPDTIDRSGQARLNASDRYRSPRDRGAGAGERTQAEKDRITGLADRGAASKEREGASLEELTGVLLRGAGLLALEQEIARAIRTRQPLVLAFVEVDHLQAIKDSRGRTAGDRILLDVASTLRSNLRSYDLIIHYGEDEFVCAIPGMHPADAPRCFGFTKTALEEAPGHGSVTVGFADLQPDDSAEDLIARADTALHRARHQQSGHASDQVWECGDLVVDELTRSVTRAGSPIRLTATEFKILAVLVRQSPRVVPKDQFFRQVWGHGRDSHLLEVHVSSLRHKLEAHGSRMIHTVWSSGYVLQP